MYFMNIAAVTTEENPEHGKLGEALVACWIEHDNEEEAVAIACDLIESDGWNVTVVEFVDEVTDEDYPEDDENRAFYEQALEDHEVIVFHVSPKYPVLSLTFEVEPTSPENTAVEAKAWIVNEALEDDYDPMLPDFWEGERVEKAVNIVSEVISENGYRVVRLIEHSPCSRDESSEDCQFYDDAEENGICLIFFYDS